MRDTSRYFFLKFFIAMFNLSTLCSIISGIFHSKFKPTMSRKFIELIEKIRTSLEYEVSRPRYRPLTKKLMVSYILCKIAESFYRFREVWVEPPNLEFHVKENLRPITLWGQLWMSDKFGCKAFFSCALESFSKMHPNYKGFKLYLEFKKEVSTAEYLDWMQFCRDCRVAPDDTHQYNDLIEGYLELAMKIIAKIGNKIQKVDESQKMTKSVILDVMKSTLIEYENQIKESVVPEITQKCFLNSMWSPKQHGIPAVFSEEHEVFVVEM